MCGIYGVIERGHGSVEKKLQAMSDAIYHRGPDDQNWDMPTVQGYQMGYGINRLAIIDVAGGQQPIHNEKGDIAIVFNGEIYNYRELRRDLEARGHKFKTNSDTECIVHLYEDYGAGCVQHLRGMFAFCIHDKRRGQLFIARDHVGIKPMYYLHDGTTFAFCSELKGLIQVKPNPGFNPDAVLAYFTYRYVPTPHTIYKGFHSLPAGHYLTYDLKQNKTTLRRWWEPNFTPIRDPYPTAKAKLKHLLTESVRLRLQSEVPLGAYLSGGVDSSLIAAIVAKELDHEINVYNIGFQEANEYGYASSVSRKLGFNYYQVSSNIDDMAGILDDVLHYMDQPLSDAACFPTLFLSRVVKKAVTVMLSGEGADELFTGYWQYDGILKQRKSLDVSLTAMRDHLSRSSYFIGANGIFNPDIIRGWDDPVSLAVSPWKNRSARTLQAKITSVDMALWLQDDLLMKVDKMSMAASVEARVPFLDRPVIEYALRLEDSFKYKGGVTKVILKEVAEEMGLPRDITRRPKMGFTVPIHNLLQGPFKDRFLDSLGSQKFKGIRYMNTRRVNEIVSRYYQGEEHWALFCWTLFCFSAWMDKHS